MDDTIEKVADHIMDIFASENIDNKQRYQEVQKILREFTPELVGAAVARAVERSLMRH